MSSNQEAKKINWGLVSENALKELRKLEKKEVFKVKVTMETINKCLKTLKKKDSKDAESFAEALLSVNPKYKVELEPDALIVLRNAAIAPTKKDRDKASKSKTQKEGPAIVYCPSIDKEMQTCIDTMIENGWVPKNNGVHVGGAKTLGTLKKTPKKVYILAHGHKTLPFFTTTGGKWSGKEMAQMLVTDGLPKDVVDIELLVCWAGASVNTKEMTDKMLAAQEKYKKAKKDKKAQEMEKYEKKFNELAEKSDWGRFGIDKDRRQADAKRMQQLTKAIRKAQKNGEKQSDTEKMVKKAMEDAMKKKGLKNKYADRVFPLSATLIGELKKHKYSEVRIRSYAAPVAQKFEEDKIVRLKAFEVNAIEASYYPDRILEWL